MLDDSLVNAQDENAMHSHGDSPAANNMNSIRHHLVDAMMIDTSANFVEVGKVV